MPTLPDEAIVKSLTSLALIISRRSAVPPSPPALIVNLPWLLDEAPPAGWKSMEAEEVEPVERMMKLVVVEESSSNESGEVVTMPTLPSDCILNLSFDPEATLNKGPVKATAGSISAAAMGLVVPMPTLPSFFTYNLAVPAVMGSPSFAFDWNNPQSPSTIVLIDVPQFL